LSVVIVTCHLSLVDAGCRESAARRFYCGRVLGAQQRYVSPTGSASHISIAKRAEKRATIPAILRGFLKIVGSAAAADWADP
jgi:hypothetical protein